jgi:hypothetical protein
MGAVSYPVEQSVEPLNTDGILFTKAGGTPLVVSIRQSVRTSVKPSDFEFLSVRLSVRHPSGRQVIRQELSSFPDCGFIVFASGGFRLTVAKL